MCEDHPRGCGEHLQNNQTSDQNRGSSPRMRGTHPRQRSYRYQAGIIPADAGNTSSTSLTCHLTEDHPRGCGEHSGDRAYQTWNQGSSPRMRGTQVPSVALRVPHGIIPADAGNTQTMTLSRTSFKDHPRGCGEHDWRFLNDIQGQGSSPRMRGTLVELTKPNGLYGIIPADAGNTFRPVMLFASRRDHPRGCGEHTLQFTVTSRFAGSSPRMRGTHVDAGGRQQGHRIIPADAGNTRARQEA